MITSPGAIAIDTTFFTIYWYGIIMAIAFVTGQAVAISITKKEYNDKNVTDNLYDLAFWTLLSGIIGARLYYVLLSFDFYAVHPQEIIMLQHGGLSIHGGLIGGILGSIIYCKHKNINFFQYADLYALGLPIAQAIGRWGNFFNSEAFGLPANLPWAIYIPIVNRPQEYKLYDYFHPTFLYESIWDILIFLILFFIIKKNYLKNKGILFFSYLILYSAGRIFIENIRIDSVLNIFNIPVAIWISVVTIIISSIMLYLIINDNKNKL